MRTSGRSRNSFPEEPVSLIPSVPDPGAPEAQDRRPPCPISGSPFPISPATRGQKRLYDRGRRPGSTTGIVVSPSRFADALDKARRDRDVAGRPDRDADARRPDAGGDDPRDSSIHGTAARGEGRRRAPGNSPVPTGRRHRERSLPGDGARRPGRSDRDRPPGKGVPLQCEWCELNTRTWRVSGASELASSCVVADEDPAVGYAPGVFRGEAGNRHPSGVTGRDAMNVHREHADTEKPRLEVNSRVSEAQLKQSTDPPCFL